MTTTTAPNSQALWVGKYFLRSYLSVLTWALGIGIAVFLILNSLSGVVEFTIGMETFEGNISFIAPPLAAVAVTAFVIAIVNAGYSRILIGQGATRSSIVIGNLLSAGVAWFYVIAVALVWRLVGNLVPSITRLEDAFPITLGWQQYVWLGGSMAAALIGGALICSLFLRWRWPVGTAILVASVVILPDVLFAFAPVLNAVDWWGTPWISAAILAGLFTWIMRGVEVN